ncbi:MAG: tRNA lysidine(34) synthetase TilS [Alphaproteobacteria bacterium]|nr:tRNA lysidine(34) synthetase TilS [Alphaproteobacteria bacterium]
MSDCALETAISAEEFARLLDGFSPLAEKIAVATSGGPDSMALALCLKRWGLRDVTALIVDHGLRAESAMEAAQTKERLEALGLRAEILRWEHEPVKARLHEAARTARYQLLIGACHKIGAGDLLLGHQREDQAETILMRLAKGSGVDGLAGIAAQRMRDGVRLLRPLLGTGKARLVATCEQAGVAFVTDPSNASAKFARGRLRTMMPLLAEEGLSADMLIELGARMGEAADAIDHYARGFLQAAAQVERGGWVRIDRVPLRDLPRAVRMRALVLALRYVHEDFYPPERGGLADLLDAISEPAPPRTFYGCIVSALPERVAILREPAAVTETASFHSGESVLWDGRWKVTGTVEGDEGLEVRALGAAPHDRLDRLAPGLRHAVPQGRVRATLPALWRGDTLYAVPAFDEKAPLRASYRKQAFP